MLKLGISVINFDTSIQWENFQLLLNVKWQKNSEMIYANKEYEILLIDEVHVLFIYLCGCVFLNFSKMNLC